MKRNLLDLVQNQPPQTEKGEPIQRVRPQVEQLVMARLSQRHSR